MKAPSIKQPWVHAILHEGKDIENRTWRSRHRGWIAIHASQSPRVGARLPSGHKTPDFKTLDYSAICAVARLVDIVTTHRSKWFYRPGRGERVNYGWVLTDVKRLRKPVKCNGMLGLWQVPPHIRRSIVRQLPKRIAVTFRRDNP
jgi:hypothetical protein